MMGGGPRPPRRMGRGGAAPAPRVINPKSNPGHLRKGQTGGRGKRGNRRLFFSSGNNTPTSIGPRGSTSKFLTTDTEEYTFFRDDEYLLGSDDDDDDDSNGKLDGYSRNSTNNEQSKYNLDAQRHVKKLKSYFNHIDDDSLHNLSEKAEQEVTTSLSEISMLCWISGVAAQQFFGYSGLFYAYENALTKKGISNLIILKLIESLSVLANGHRMNQNALGQLGWVKRLVVYLDAYADEEDAHDNDAIIEMPKRMRSRSRLKGANTLREEEIKRNKVLTETEKSNIIAELEREEIAKSAALALFTILLNHRVNQDLALAIPELKIKLEDAADLDWTGWEENRAIEVMKLLDMHPLHDDDEVEVLE